MTGDVNEPDPGAAMDDEEQTNPVEPPPHGGVPRWAQWGLMAAALVVAITGALAWHDARADEDAARAERRDAVLIAAHRQIETLQTMDHREIELHLERWADATSGVMHDQLQDVSEQDLQLIRDQEKRSTGRVVDAALTSLGSDTATVLAAVEVTTIDDAEPDAEPVVKRNRFAADLVLRDGEWKLENLQQVAVKL